MKKFFKLKEYNTTVGTEVLAGVTTFFTMAYILFVNPSILADAIEAIIAAMYLDGGITIAEEFIKKNILSDIDIFTENQLSDYKTALQEHVQRKPNQLLTYESIAESGPDHKKTFTVHVLLNGRAIGEGNGRTKKEAEQYAAKSGLAEIAK